MPIKINEVVIVEGKYDKIKLSSFLDATIITTNGFGVFKDKELLNLIRRLAKTRGIVILTDSDGAGFKIRSYLKGSIPEGQIKHAYIPDILGKEKRKEKPSGEGKLGVEGMEKSVILDALSKAGVGVSDDASDKNPITKADLYEFGFSGTDNSKEKRNKLLSLLELPHHLSTNALVEVLNIIMNYNEFEDFINKNF